MHRSACKQLFSGPLTHVLSMLCVFIKLFSHANAKQKTERVSNFSLYWLFSSDTVAVKGLSHTQTRPTPRQRLLSGENRDCTNCINTFKRDPQTNPVFLFLSCLLNWKGVAWGQREGGGPYFLLGLSIVESI